MNSTRDALHRIGTHVLARARHAATGKFGLRSTPGGFGTPAFGPAVEVVRVAGGGLVRERDGRVSTMPIDGATLADLAAFTSVDLSTAFSAGEETPPLGDPHATIEIDASEVARLADWWQFGWRILDAVVATSAEATAIQLWPEHFDAGTSVAVGDGGNDRCNLGASPGDEFSDEPYLYVSPWTADRPGDPPFWNAPFGAVVRRTELLEAPDPYGAGVTFLRRGLELLG